jgi:hypothetical protein
MNDTKTLTIRLPLADYERAVDLAKARHQSLNKLVQDGLKSIEAEERERRLFDDFTTIAEFGCEDNDMDFAVEAQAEVVTAL